MMLRRRKQLRRAARKWATKNPDYWCVRRKDPKVRDTERLSNRLRMRKPKNRKAAENARKKRLKNPKYRAAYLAAASQRATKYHSERMLASPDYREKRRALARRQGLLYPENRRARKHRRRARELGNGGSWTASEWAALLVKYGHRCLACGLGEVQLRCLRRKLVPDHVIPLVHDGRNDISNLQPLCHGTGGCNNRKGTRHTDYR